MVGVVEHCDFFHRVKEPSGIQNCRGQNTDTQRALEHSESTEEQDCCHGDVSDEDQTRVVDTKQLDQSGVVSAIVLNQPTEVVLVCLLLAESLHRTNTGHGLNEVLDQSRGGHSLLTVTLIGSKLEPAGQHRKRNKGNQQD